MSQKKYRRYYDHRTSSSRRPSSCYLHQFQWLRLNLFDVKEITICSNENLCPDIVDTDVLLVAHTMTQGYSSIAERDRAVDFSCGSV